MSIGCQAENFKLLGGDAPDWHVTVMLSLCVPQRDAKSLHSPSSVVVMNEPPIDAPPIPDAAFTLSAVYVAQSSVFTK